MTLPKRQRELLERVCLKRYRVLFSHYLGTFNPNERVTVYDYGRGRRPETAEYESADQSFRPSTAEALRKRGLIHYSKKDQVAGHSLLQPTRAGLDHYLASRETHGGKP